MRRTVVKFSRVLELRARGCDQQRGLAFLSPSLRILLVLSILAVLVGTAPKLVAQSVTSGDIAGLVTDPSGAVLTNASVTLKSLENGSAQAQSTNSRGVYRFSLLPPGRYTVSRRCCRLSASQCNRCGDYRSSYDRQH